MSWAEGRSVSREPNVGLGHLEGCTVRRVGELAFADCAPGCPHVTWLLEAREDVYDDMDAALRAIPVDLLGLKWRHVLAAVVLLPLETIRDWWRRG
jgi:hypothetical protein